MLLLWSFPTSTRASLNITPWSPFVPTRVARYIFQEAGSHDDAEGEFTQSDDKVNDKVFLTCPWHEFKFGVESGRSSEHGLVAEVWQVVVADGFVTLPALQESTIKSIRLFQRTMF
jgi:hypothetical protein